MAGKATSVYVDIVESNTHKIIEHKMFFNKKAANDFVLSKLEEFPKPHYYYSIETY